MKHKKAFDSKNKKIFFFTTPVFYPNAQLHLGHAYCLIVANAIVNYKKSQNYQVYFQTGSDDHGEKIEKKAFSLGLSPFELAKKNSLVFEKLWKALEISDYNFYHTFSSSHIQKTQEKFTRLLKNNDIYLGNYEGKYCVSCEDYVAEKKALEGKFCPTPNCRSNLRKISESAYFFKTSKYLSKLLEQYEKSPDFLLPFSVKKELFSNFLSEKYIPDLCITRRDIKWGIKVPNQEKMVIYVWFEALLNYINSEEGEQAFDSPETEIVHLVGKEITRFHCIYWPTILFALNKRLPNKILAHGWLVDSRGEKESKSKGNVNDPFELLKKYPKDLLKVYLIAKVNFLQDGIFSKQALEEFHQSFLVNNLGNLISRLSKIIYLYNKKVIPPFEKSEVLELENYFQECQLLIEKFQTKMNNYKLTEAFNEIENFLKFSNRIISTLAPWNLFKTKKIKTLNAMLNYLSNGVKIATFLLKNFAPNTCSKIFSKFNIDDSKISWKNLEDFSFLNNTKINFSEEHLYSSLLNEKKSKN